MTCSTACVLTNAGGVSEYALDGVNCLLVEPGKPADFTSAIINIIKDRNLKEALERGGIKTVSDYCHKREAKETLSYFKMISDFEKSL